MPPRDPRTDIADMLDAGERIVQFRNVLIHAHHLVDRSIVWDGVRSHLPVLLAELHAAMTSLGQGDPAE